MEPNTFTLTSEADGLPLAGYAWPAERSHLAVVIAHGAAEHALRYERFAAALNGTGVDAWAIDHRGHGRSPGPAGLGDFGAGGWNALVADIGQLISHVRGERPGIPVVLMGHSMGAAAAQQFTPDGSRTIDALILSGSTARPVPRQGDPPRAFEPNKVFEPARTAYDWLSRDESEVDKYLADPLCGFDAFGDRLASTLRADPFVLADPERLARIRPDLPCLLVAGTADPVNGNMEGLRLLEERWSAAGVERIDTLYYEGGRHEMLNELNRDQVTADIIGWLNGLFRA